MWWHILVVVVPHNLRITDMATLWVTDGSNNDDFMPDLGAQFDYNLLIAADIATASGTIVANLYQIPNAVTHPAVQIMTPQIMSLFLPSEHCVL